MIEALTTSAALGLLSSASPCLLPLYPGFLAYLSGLLTRQEHGVKRGHFFLGFFVLAGVLTMMLLLGLIIALLSISVGSALAVVIPFADLIIILLGVLLVLNINPFKRLPQLQMPLVSHPFANAFVYGLLYGPLALPCSGPLVVAIFALSFNVSDALDKLLVFLAFGLGFGLPLLVLSLLAGSTQRWLTQKLTQHARLINFVSGLLLIVVGIYDLVNNWEMIISVLNFA